jgi:hypothetical protein
MKTCSKCKQTKPKTEFHNHKRAKDGKQYHCKQCMHGTMVESGYLNAYLSQSWKGRATTILSGMKRSSAKRGHKWDDSWWSVEKIQDQIENKACAVTGIRFSLSDIETKNKKRPFVPSPDRIDNSKGYEPANVQWVVFIFNVMKSNFDDADVAHFLQSLKNLEDFEVSKVYEESLE